MSIEQLLGPKGPFAASLANHGVRPGQLAMAAGVERALSEDRILLCEAGTGTGKSLAYLLPAARWARKARYTSVSRPQI